MPKNEQKRLHQIFEVFSFMDTILSPAQRPEIFPFLPKTERTAKSIAVLFAANAVFDLMIPPAQQNLTSADFFRYTQHMKYMLYKSIMISLNWCGKLHRHHF